MGTAPQPCRRGTRHLFLSLSDADAPKYGRQRLHGPRKLEFTEDDRDYALADKKQRRTVLLHEVLASGAADFEAAPGREDFGDDDEGALLHEERFNEYIDGNFDDAGAEVRSLDQRDRKVGIKERKLSPLLPTFTPLS